MVFLRLEPLEDRIVLDGAIAVDVATPPAVTAIAANHGTDTHVLVVSDSVVEHDLIASAAKDNVKVIVYNSNSNDLNGLSQKINNAIGDQKVASIAFFTGGQPGEISLFQNISVNKDTIQTQMMKDFWRDIGNHILSNGSVDILGCDVAGDVNGLEFINSMDSVINSSGSHISVNASTDLTGSAKLGGNWNLEYSSAYFKSTGSISLMNDDISSTYFNTDQLSNWDSVLAPGIFVGVGGGNNVVEGGAANFHSINLIDAPTGGGVVVFDILHNGGTNLHVLQSQLTFTSGNFNVFQKLQFAGIEDGIVEGDQTYNITLHINPLLTTAPNYLSLADRVLNAIVIDADSPPTVDIHSIQSTSDGPGFAGDPNMPDYVQVYFPVTLSRPYSSPITVNYQTVDGTASSVAGPNQDFVSASGSVVFAPGEVLKLVQVNIVRDVQFEPTEDFQIQLTGISGGGVLGFTSVTEQIDNDDNLPGITFSTHSNGLITSSGTNSSFTIVLDEQPTQDVTVTLVKDHATEGLFDGVSTTKVLTFNKYNWLLPQTVTVVGGTIASTTSSTISIQSVTSADTNWNGLIDSDTVQIFNKGIVVGTTPSFTINNASVSEGNFLTITPLNFTVTLNPGTAPIGTVFTVNLATNDLTGPVGIGDFTTITGSNVSGSTLTIVVGTDSLTQTISVGVIGDDDYELNENFAIEMFNPTASSGPVPIFLDNQGLATIINDDIAISPFGGGGGTESGAESGKDYNLFGINQVLSRYSFLYYAFDITVVNGGTAVLGSDFLSQTVSIVVKPGSRSANTTSGFYIIPDDIRESTETIATSITNTFDSGPNNLTPVFTISISNDDPIPGYYVTDVTGSESSGSFAFTVGLTNRSSADMLTNNPPNETVVVTTANNTATSPSDYTAIGLTTLTFNTSTGLQQTFSVPIINDTVYEPTESFFVNLSNPQPNSPTAFTLVDSQGIGTILDNDSAPTVTIVDSNGANPGSAEVLEGNLLDNNVLTFNVSLSNASFEDITFSYSTVDGTATLADSDYTQVSGQTFTILAGQTSASFTVAVTGDLVYENNEDMSISLAVTSGTVSGSTSFSPTGIIINDDAPPIIVINDVIVNESAGTLTFTVTRTGETAFDVNFDYSTADGIIPYFSAIAGLDYTATSGSLTIVAGGGTNSTTISVSIIPDNIYEQNESFFMNLTNPTNIDTFNSDLQGVGTILNDDSVPIVSLTVANNAVDEGIIGEPLSPSIITPAGVFNFTISLSNPTYEDLYVSVSTADGVGSINFLAMTAPAYAVDPQGNPDYIPLDDTFVILAGTTTATFSVDAVADEKFEFNEYFNVNMTAVTGSDSGTATMDSNNQSVQAIILNDDNRPAIEILGQQSVLEGTAPVGPYGIGGPPTTPVAFTIIRHGATAFDIDLTSQTIAGTAGAFGDSLVSDNDFFYADNIHSVLLASSANTETLSNFFIAKIIQDNKFEANETFTLENSLGSNAFVDLVNSNLDYTVTIVNDDAPPVFNITDASTLEGNSGTTPLVFTLSMSNPTYEPVQVNINTNDGTNPQFNLHQIATLSDNDYLSLSAVLDFSDANITDPNNPIVNNIAKTVTVLIKGDTKYELNESFTLDYLVSGGGVNSSGSDLEAVGTIINDDAPPTISLAPIANSIFEGNSGDTPLEFDILLSNPTFETLHVSWIFQDGEIVGVPDATQPSDYLPGAGDITIPENATSAKVFAHINGDTVIEADEAFSMVVLNVTGTDGITQAALTGSPSAARVIILNDDNPSTQPPFVIPPTYYIPPYSPGGGDIPPYEVDESLECGLGSNLLCNISLEDRFGGMKLVDAQIGEDIFDGIEIGVSDFHVIEHEGSGLQGYFTIYISVKPDSEVVIDLEAKGISQGSITPSIVIFTPENWNIPQVVEVNDPNWNPEQASEILTNLIKSGEVYKNVEIPDVSIPTLEGAYAPPSTPASAKAPVQPSDYHSNQNDNFQKNQSKSESDSDQS